MALVLVLLLTDPGSHWAGPRCVSWKAQLDWSPDVSLQDRDKLTEQRCFVRKADFKMLEMLSPLNLEKKDMCILLNT